MYRIPRVAARTIWQHSFLSRTGRCGFSTSRWLLNELITPKVNYEAKYAEKLQQRAAEQGLTVEQLKQKLKEEEVAKRKEKAAASAPVTPVTPSTQKPGESTTATTSAPPPVSIPTRKDSSPVKPLTELLNIDKLLETPHTADQISLLWRAYHASRSKGTGRGYLCATIPLDAYHKMTSVANKYPHFILPVPREGAQVGEDKSSADQKAYEMFFMQWDFHGAPPEPKPITADLFAKLTPSKNPHTSTVLFTPLQEYKQRTTFATPYLVLTNYTDLASSHRIVLLRGEITPLTSGSIDAGGDGRYMLSQQDAQLLALGIQKFYLWSEDAGKGEREALLKTFHEDPEEFKWEELLKHTEFSA